LKQVIMLHHRDGDEDEIDYGNGNAGTLWESFCTIMLVIGIIALSVTLIHWHTSTLYVVMFTLAMMHMVSIHGIFVRRGEHRVHKVLIVAWMLYMVYSTITFIGHVGIGELWVYLLRDTFVLVQLWTGLIGSLLPSLSGGAAPGTVLVQRASAIAPGIAAYTERVFGTVHTAATEHLPYHLESIDQGATRRAVAEIQSDCTSIQGDCRSSLGLRWIRLDTSPGFVAYQLLLCLPFTQNNMIAFSVWWAVARLLCCSITYIVIDDIFRPRVAQVHRSGPIVLASIQYLLYVHPYVLVVACPCHLAYLLYMAHKTRQRRDQLNASAAADAGASAFLQDSPMTHAPAAGEQNYRDYGSPDVEDGVDDYTNNTVDTHLVSPSQPKHQTEHHHDRYESYPGGSSQFVLEEHVSFDGGNGSDEDPF